MNLNLDGFLLLDKFTNISKQCPHLPKGLNYTYFICLLGELNETVNVKYSALCLIHRNGYYIEVTRANTVNAFHEIDLHSCDPLLTPHQP